MKLRFRPFLKIAPGFLGAFSLALVGSGCREKDRTADWSGRASSSSAVVASEKSPRTTPVASTSGKAGQQSIGGPVRFVSYNVENWLTMDRYVDGKQVPGLPKPEKERRAVVKAIVSAKPDILGISEIGNEGDVMELQRHLEDAGMPLPHSHLNRGVDPTRSLVILSRYPIKGTGERKTLNYRLQGKDYGMQRGILDATISTPAGSFRFLGVHLKSKREVEEGNEEEMRRNEAHLFRRELDSILSADPQARLVVYGDFNDTRQSPSVKTIHNPGKGPQSLNMIALKDSRGEYWTHHWAFQDVYSRIDYVLVSQALRRSVDWDECKIVDTEAVTGASDHRPLLVILK